MWQTYYIMNTEQKQKYFYVSKSVIEIFSLYNVQMIT